MSKQFTITLHVTLHDKPKIPASPGIREFTDRTIPVVDVQGSVLGDCRSVETFALREGLSSYEIDYFYGDSNRFADLHTHVVRQAIYKTLNSLLGKAKPSE